MNLQSANVKNWIGGAYLYQYTQKHYMKWQNKNKVLNVKGLKRHGALEIYIIIWTGRHAQ